MKQGNETPASSGSVGENSSLAKKLSSKSNQLGKKMKQRPVISLLIVGLLVGVIAALAVYTTQANAFKYVLVSGGGWRGTCVSQGHTLLGESNQTTTKRNYAVCQIDSSGKNSLYPNDWRWLRSGPNTIGDFEIALQKVKELGYTESETCFNMVALTNNAKVDLDLFGDYAAKRTGVSVTTGDYESYCYTAPLTNNNHNAGIIVTSGTVRLSSITVASKKTPPNDDAVRAGRVVPYDANSAWNTPIGANPAIHPKSKQYVEAIADNDKPLTADVDQYSVPVYMFDASTPRVTIKMTGYFSSYDSGDDSRKGYGFAPTITSVPVPEGAKEGEGSDGQIVFWDPINQVEWGFWRWDKKADGSYTAQNGYRYHTGPGYFGRFADGLSGRGAGTPYFSGLVRRWEIDQGRIDHAISFAYAFPEDRYTYPASKSDGTGVLGVDLPEGARLQLNPNLTEADFNRYGLNAKAKVVARALQEYGMIVIDRSGSSKLYVEDRLTAGWGSDVNRDFVSGIPWSEFRVLNFSYSD